VTSTRPEAVEASAVASQKLGRYLLRYQLASGGMGDVYLAQMQGAAGVERWVALKVLRDELARERKFISMFLDEARIASRLHHPNLCSVVDFGEVDGRYYLTLEYLHGETLSGLVRRVHQARAELLVVRPVDLVARIIADAARGLHAAHETRGPDGEPLVVVHRDVSPQNIFVLYDGHAKVMDFGIAAARLRESKTTTGEFKGKFAYGSPEQLTGGKVDRRTDVFALGIVLWEATLGKRLFRAESEGETVLNVIQKEVPAPSSFRADFPAGVERVILRALQRDPARRYQTAEAMAEELDDYLATLGHAVGASQVRSVMHAVFADRLTVRDQMLIAPPVEVGAALPAPIQVERPLSSVDTVASSPIAKSGRRSVLRRRSTWVAAIAVVVVAGGGIVALSAVPQTEMPKIQVEPSARPSTLTPLAAAPTAAPVASPEPGSVAPETSPASETAFGSLNLLTRPTYADVYLRGRKIGTTPLFQRRLPVGRHVLKLLPGGHEPHKSVAVTIRAGRTTSESVQLAQ
jgi:serine/threonine-protein kinase